ncbi:hypothetical protein B0H11DRAFT_2205338 [Mycena galericulata]|nr:hypothetical protein B0H11DRAFT_2205338 [Mycena galericulata]
MCATNDCPRIYTNFIGHLVKLNGGSVDYYQAGTFMDATGDPPYIGSDAWEEATANSIYLNDCFQDDRDGLAWGGDDFTENHNGQTLASSAITDISVVVEKKRTRDWNKKADHQAW